MAALLTHITCTQAGKGGSMKVRGRNIWAAGGETSKPTSQGRQGGQSRQGRQGPRQGRQGPRQGRQGPRQGRQGPRQAAPGTLTGFAAAMTLQRAERDATTPDLAMDTCCCSMASRRQWWSQPILSNSSMQHTPCVVAAAQSVASPFTGTHTQVHTETHTHAGTQHTGL